MEETPRIGIVGRWLAHWSFWPVERSEYPELADWLDDAETDTIVVPDFSRLFGFRSTHDGACETLALQPARIADHFEEPTRLCFWIKAR